MVLIAGSVAYNLGGCGGWAIKLGIKEISGQCAARELSSQTSAVVVPKADLPTPLQFPKGYVYYEIADGRQTDFGELKPYRQDTLPKFEEFKFGDILVSLTEKQLRTLPTTTTGTVQKLGAGTCFQIIEAPKYRNNLAKPNESSGWLAVQIVACPSTT